MIETSKETKAQRAERLKGALNPWSAYAEIERFAREGWDSIPPEWLNTYFRWWGIYTQGDGVGAVGGTGGEGKAVRYLLVRIRIPNGLLTAAQTRRIADLAERYARGVADITVRQNIQLHWVRIEDLPAVIQGLSEVGISTLGSCGDVTRNVTGCPVAGVDADEIVDASPLVQAATAMLNGSPEFYNLPRKFKVSITGCRVWCSYPEINDVGLTAVRQWERTRPWRGRSATASPRARYRRPSSGCCAPTLPSGARGRTSGSTARRIPTKSFGTSWPASWWRRSSATSRRRGLPTASTAELHNHKGDTTCH